MKDRALYRLEAVKYLCGFKDMLKIRKDAIILTQSVSSNSLKIMIEERNFNLRLIKLIEKNDDIEIAVDKLKNFLRLIQSVRKLDELKYIVNKQSNILKTLQMVKDIDELRNIIDEHIYVRNILQSVEKKQQLNNILEEQQNVIYFLQSINKTKELALAIQEKNNEIKLLQSIKETDEISQSINKRIYFLKLLESVNNMSELKNVTEEYMCFKNIIQAMEKKRDLNSLIEEHIYIVDLIQNIEDMDQLKYIIEDQMIILKMLKQIKTIEELEKVKLNQREVLKLFLKKEDVNLENMINRFELELKVLKSVSTMDLNGILEIDLPSNFEYIIQSSIKARTKYNNDFIIIDDYEIDYARIKSMLRYSYNILNTSTISNEYENNELKICDNYIEGSDDDFIRKEDDLKRKEHVLKIEKEELLVNRESTKVKDDDAEVKAKMILLLFELSFDMIVEYFPIDMYGFPSNTLLLILMNLIIGEEIKIEDKDPCVFMNNDVYSLRLKSENDYLKEILKKNNIDYNKILDSDTQYNNDYEMLDKIINANPVCGIIINPSFKINQINKSMDLKNKINNSVNKLKDLYVANNNNISNEYLTIARYAKDYVHLRFNLNKTNAEIINNNNKNSNIRLGDERVSKEIKELCSATGLIDPLSKAKK